MDPIVPARFFSLRLPAFATIMPEARARRDESMTPLPNDLLRLSVPERIALAQALWDSIAAESHPPLVSDAQRRELERRAAEDDALPDEVVPWEVVKADILARLRLR